jgi:plastocyanin
MMVEALLDRMRSGDRSGTFGVVALILMLVGMLSMSTAVEASIVSPAALQDAAPATEPVVVLMTEYALGTDEIVAIAGDIHLRLVNAGIRRHTLTVFIDGVEHISPEVRPGDAAEWLLHISTPGRYDLWCNEYRHLEKGMGSTLVVR